MNLDKGGKGGGGVGIIIIISFSIITKNKFCFDLSCPIILSKFCILYCLIK